MRKIILILTILTIQSSKAVIFDFGLDYRETISLVNPIQVFISGGKYLPGPESLTFLPQIDFYEGETEKKLLYQLKGNGLFDHNEKLLCKAVLPNDVWGEGEYYTFRGSCPQIENLMLVDALGQIVINAKKYDFKNRVGVTETKDGVFLFKIKDKDTDLTINSIDCKDLRYSAKRSYNGEHVYCHNDKPKEGLRKYIAAEKSSYYRDYYKKFYDGLERLIDSFEKKNYQEVKKLLVLKPEEKKKEGINFLFVCLNEKGDEWVKDGKCNFSIENSELREAVLEVKKVISYLRFNKFINSRDSRNPQVNFTLRGDWKTFKNLRIASKTFLGNYPYTPLDVFDYRFDIYFYDDQFKEVQKSKINTKK